MKTKEAVHALLIQHRGQAISGEQMAVRLQLSRTAIWKAINELRKDGYQITSKPKVGYIYQGSDILSSQEIQAELQGKKLPPLTIQIRDSLASTNQTLKKMAIDGANNHTILITRQQTATKGRFNRPFFASEKHGLYFSLLLYPNQQSFEEITQYTLIAAVAMAQAMEELSHQSIDIKWVNDLYLNGKKIAGILSEAISDFESQTISAVIIGIGVNFSIPSTDFPIDLQAKAGSLFNNQPPSCTRNQLLASFLHHFYQCLDEQQSKNYLAEYRRRSFVLGKQVHFTYQKKACKGVATDIGPLGELIVETSTGQQLFLSSGEISLTSIDELAPK